MLDRRLLQEAANSRYKLALIIGFGMAGGVLAVLQADLLARTINGVFLDGLDAAGAQNWLAALAAVMVLRSALVWAASVVAHHLAVDIKRKIRTRLVHHLFRLGPVGTVGMHSGDVVNTLSQGVENLEPWFAKFLPQLASAVLIPVLILALVFPLDAASALIMLVTAPLIPVFMALIGRAAGRLNQRQWDKLSRLNAHFLDVLKGLVTLKLFGRSKEQIAIIERMSGELRDTTLSVLRVAFLSSLALELLTTISIAVVAVTVGLRLLYWDMEFYQAFFLLLIAPEFYLPLRLLGGHYHAGMAGTAAANSIFALLDKPPLLAGGSENMVRQDKVGVVFHNVRCTYGSERPDALNGISFEVPAGARVALVGPSGAGKTTVMNLLLGMMAPQQGEILVNGLPLADVKREDWLQHVAFVPQFPHMFCGTVAENIRFGLEGVTMGDIVRAAQAAGAHEFISRLPESYMTVIGEGGTGLSGGEKRRIAIARAFLRNAPLLILDEATASLDAENENIIEDALARLMEGRTVIMSAHRLKTVRQAGSILVLDNGRIVEEGTHSSLISKQGLYAKLVSAANTGCCL